MSLHDVDAATYLRAKAAYEGWATWAMLDSGRQIPDSTLARWDDLPRADQAYIWSLYAIVPWDALREGQRLAWAMVVEALDRQQEGEALARIRAKLEGR